jgi:E1-E2 ATPase/Cation transporter/ATPase, N-terminus
MQADSSVQLSGPSGRAASTNNEALTATRVSSAPLAEVLRWADTTAEGLSGAEASARLLRYGPNSVRTQRVSALAVLGRQLRSAVLGRLAAMAVVSFFLGDSRQAIIIGVILAASIGLGFVNEYRAERASAALHSSVHHNAVARRDGRFDKVDVNQLVRGDVIRLTLGEAVPADVRLIDVNGLECNESILSGESAASEKSVESVNMAGGLADSINLAFMGTIVSAGGGLGVVYATGADTEFGRIAAGLGERQPETEFQTGLRRFSYLLLWVAIILTLLILVTNLLLRRPVIDSVLFALAIAVGITPQLLPAVVSTSLATGSRRLARLNVLVKRLVCIEDPGRVPSGAGCAGTDVRPGVQGAALGQDVRGRRGVDARHRRGDRDVRRHPGRRDRPRPSHRPDGRLGDRAAGRHGRLSRVRRRRAQPDERLRVGLCVEELARKCHPVTHVRHRFGQGTGRQSQRGGREQQVAQRLPGAQAHGVVVGAGREDQQEAVGGAGLLAVMSVVAVGQPNHPVRQAVPAQLGHDAHLHSVSGGADQEQLERGRR